jgi:DNA ligase-1
MELIGKVAYLTQGVLYPDFVGVEIGIAEKLAIESISKVTGAKKEDVNKAWKSIGDIGSAAEKLLSGSLTGMSSIDDLLQKEPFYKAGLKSSHQMHLGP